MKTANLIVMKNVCQTWLAGKSIISGSFSQLSTATSFGDFQLPRLIAGRCLPWYRPKDRPWNPEKGIGTFNMDI